MREVWLSLIKTSGAKIYGVVISVLSLTLTARVLGPDGRGQIVAAMAWVTTFATFGHLSLGPVVMRKATLDKGEAWLSGALGVLLGFTVSMTLICYFVAAVLTILKPAIFGKIPLSLLILAFSALPFLVWENYGNYLLMATNSIDKFNKYQVASRTISILLLSVLLFVVRLGEEAVLIANLSAFFAGATATIVYLRKRIPRISVPSLQECWSYLRSGSAIHLSTIGTYLFTSTDVLLLNYMKGSTSTGLYQVGMQIITVLSILPQSASIVLYGKIASSCPKEAWHNQKRLIFPIMALICGTSLAVGATCSFWLPLLLGSDFLPSVNIFRFQLISLPLMTFCILLGPQWISRGLFWQASVVSIGTGLLNLLMNRLLIPKYEIYGAIIASVASYSLIVFINIYMYFVWDRQSGAET